MARTDGIRVHIYGDYDNKQIDKAIRDLKTLREHGEGVGSAMAVQGAKFQAAGATMAAVGTKLTKGLTLPIVGLGTAAVLSSVAFESAFAGVRKTVDASEAQFAELERGIRDMSLRLPASAESIARVAEAAGQLGIETGNILSFTETMVNLGEATNLAATDAATALARLANITQMPQDQFDRLGSTIVALGNNLATTESEIVELGLRLAGAGKQIGLTQDQILGFAGALSSVGIEAEAGGSAFSKVFLNIQTAVMNGGKELEGFARIAGVSAQEFARQFREAPEQAITLFVAGLGKIQASGGNVVAALESVGVTEVRMRDALLRSAGAGTILADSLGIASAAWEENTALTNEAEQRYKTTESQLLMLKNQVVEIARTFGDVLVPIMLEVLEAARPLISGLQWLADGFKNLDPGVQRVIAVLVGLAAAVGPAVFVLGKLTGALGFVMVKMTAANGVILGLKGTLASIGASLATFSMQMKAAMIPAATQMGALGAAAKFTATAVKTAFLSMATAVKGFLVSLGPVGIAIAVLGTAYAVFAGQAANAQAKVDAFRDALILTGDAARSTSLQVMIDELMDLEVGFLTTQRAAVETLDEIGIGIDDAAIALTGTNEQFDAFIESVQLAGETAGLSQVHIANLIGPLQDLRQSYIDGAGAAATTERGQSALTSATDKLGISTEGATGGVLGLGDGLNGLGEDAANAENAMKSLSDMFSGFDANVAAIRARDSFRAYMRDFGDSLANNNRDLLNNSKAAQTNRDTIIGAFEKKRDEILRWAEANGAGQDEVEAKWGSFVTRFRKRLVEEGFSEADLEEFFGANNLNVAADNFGLDVENAIGDVGAAGAAAGTTAGETIGRALGGGMGTGVKKYQPVFNNVGKGAVDGAADATIPHAFNRGASVGDSMARGMAHGLTATNIVNMDAARVVRNAERAARTAAESQSPSRLFARIGNDLILGLVVGMQEKSNDAEAFAKKLPESLEKAFRSRLDAFRGVVNEQLQIIEDAKAAINSYADTVVDSVIGSLDFATTDAEGNPLTPEQMVNLLLGDIANRESMVQSMVNSGIMTQLPPALAQKILSLPPDAAIALVNYLAANPAQLAQLNTNYQALANYTLTALGIPMGEAFATIGDQSATKAIQKAKARITKESGKFKSWVRSHLQTEIVIDVRYRVVGGIPSPSGAGGDLVVGARGGIVNRPTFALIGEAGPEAVVPLDRTRGNDPLPTTGRSSKTATTINLTVNAGMGTDGAEVGRLIVDAIKQYERRNGAIYVAA